MDARPGEVHGGGGAQAPNPTPTSWVVFLGNLMPAVLAAATYLGIRILIGKAFF